MDISNREFQHDRGFVADSAHIYFTPSHDWQTDETLTYMTVAEERMDLVVRGVSVISWSETRRDVPLQLHEWLSRHAVDRSSLGSGDYVVRLAGKL